MIFKLIAIIILLIIGFLILSFVVYTKDVKKKMKNRRTIETIIVNSKTFDGNEINNDHFSTHKLTMINIWGTFCPSCIKELPDLQEIYDEFKDKQVGILGVVVDVPLENPKEKDFSHAKKILSENKIEYPNVLLDSQFKACTTGAVFLIPTTIFVDQHGQIIGDLLESAYSKETYIENINTRLDHLETKKNHSLNIKNKSNLSNDSEMSYCTLDGTCVIKKDDPKEKSDD